MFSQASTLQPISSQSSPMSSQAPLSLSTPPLTHSTNTCTPSPNWSRNFESVRIQPFTSQTGPTINVPEIFSTS